MKSSTVIARLIVSVATISALSLIMTGCGGGSSTVTVTNVAEQPTIDADDAPQSGSEVTTGINAGAKEVSLGQTGSDASLAFKVTRFSATAGNVAVQSYADPIKPASGAKMIVVDVVVKNEGQTAQMPFCGGTGSVLIDTENRNFNPITNQYTVAGNDEVCTDLNPGFKRTVKLVFEIPTAAKVSAVALWDANEEGDFSGNTWVRVSKQ